MRECKYGEAYFNFRFRVRQRLGDRHSPSEDGRPCGRPMARRKTGILADALWPVGRRAILADALWPVGRRASLRTPYGPSEDGRPCGRPTARRKTGILADALWPVGRRASLRTPYRPSADVASLRTPSRPSEHGRPCGRPMARTKRFGFERLSPRRTDAATRTAGAERPSAHRALDGGGSTWLRLSRTMCESPRA